MAVFPKAYADVVQRFRVPGGFLLAAALAWFSDPTPESMMAAAPVCLAGLGLRAWAAGHLRKNQRLTTSGPYAWMRNPLYAGSLILVLGFVVASAVPWLALLFAAVFGLIYWPVMEQEEQHLRKLFPEFDAYAESVPLLWPKPPRRKSAAGFSRELYLRNQEFKALSATVVGFALMGWKAVS